MEMIEREGRGNWKRRRKRKDWKEREAMIGLETMVKPASGELVYVGGEINGKSMRPEAR